MNVSSLVHAGRIGLEQGGDIFNSSYPPLKPKRVPMASAKVLHPYAMPVTYPPYSYLSVPQAPPSPPVEEAPKCSLPSISSLLDIANSPATQVLPQFAQTTEKHPSQYTPTTMNQCRLNFPPTPPLQTNSGFDSRRSPSTSSISIITAPCHYYASSSINNLDPHAQRQATHSVQRRVTIPYSAPACSPSYTPSPHPIISYYPSPVQTTPPPQPPPPLQISNQVGQTSGLSYQRPLPQNFSTILVTVKQDPSSGTSPWQHHHYISPSSQASFPQSQDRYVCQTCNKAFSRPSSLRIHSHSHTGEKPFKCPHQGCSKAFSVRSNMKRHERGCHPLEGSSQ